jgi:hypothetical protein
MNQLRNTLKEKYSQIPNELITDMSLSAGALRVLLYLFTKPDNWNVYNLDICKQLEISEQTLTKYWKILLDSKWLKRDKARDGEGKLTGGYVYLIGEFSISIKSTEQVKSIEHSNNKPIKQKETNNKKTSKKEIVCNEPKVEVITNQETTPIRDFENFWLTYPRKYSKGRARMAYYKAMKKTTQMILLEAIEIHKCGAEWKKDNGKYIPKPANWLDGECWLDETKQENTLADKMAAVRQMSEEGIIQ